MNCLLFAGTLSFLVRSVFLIFLVYFSVVLLFVFTFLNPCCDVRYHSRIKTMFNSSLPPVVLHLLCLHAQSNVQHIWCCAFCFVCLRLVCPILPVSLDCPFLIALSVFSTVCYLQKTTQKINDRPTRTIHNTGCDLRLHVD